jgi:hypothetical protein
VREQAAASCDHYAVLYNRSMDAAHTRGYQQQIVLAAVIGIAIIALTNFCSCQAIRPVRALAWLALIPGLVSFAPLVIAMLRLPPDVSSIALSAAAHADDLLRHCHHLAGAWYASTSASLASSEVRDITAVAVMQVRAAGAALQQAAGAARPQLVAVITNVLPTYEADAVVMADFAMLLIAGLGALVLLCAARAVFGYCCACCCQCFRCCRR